MAAPARFTREAYERLQAELDSLKQKRNEVRLDVKETREQGDLKENFAYHAAREQQGILEARIVGLESRLGSAEIIEPGAIMDEVVLGVPVTVQMQGAPGSAPSERQYTIISPEEMEDFTAEGAASSESVIGQALMGRKVGDTIEVESPRGTVRFQVLSVG